MSPSGQPKQLWHNGLTWYGSGDRFAGIDVQYTSDYYADNANDLEIEDHWQVNLKAGDGWRLGYGGTRLGAHVGIRNLLDEEYIENVRSTPLVGATTSPLPGAPSTPAWSSLSRRSIQ